VLAICIQPSVYVRRKIALQCTWTIFQYLQQDGPRFYVLCQNWCVRFTVSELGKNIRGGGKPFTSSLNICPEACSRKGWGRRSNASPPPLPPPFFPVYPWIFHTKTTQPSFSFSVFPVSEDSRFKPRGQIQSPWLGDKVDSDISRLWHRVASCTWCIQNQNEKSE
jgi:hypothetical protein